MAHNKRYIPSTNSVDLLSKIEEIDFKINDPSSTLIDIKRYISEMRSIVEHARLIYYKTTNILNENISKLEEKINEITNEKNVEEYSNNWLKFMHKEYTVNADTEFEINNEFAQESNDKIKLKNTLIIRKNNLLTFEDDNITLKLNQLTLATTFQEIENLIFEYSPDIIKNKNKNKRHLGSFKTLESDISRLERHKTLLDEEKNKVKNHIIYSILLYLLLLEKT